MAAPARGDQSPAAARIGDFAAFAAALAARYGPGGSFWQAHPDLTPVPVLDYEIWNEENSAVFWQSQADAPERAADLSGLAAELPGSNCGVDHLLVYAWTTPESNPLDPESWFGIWNRNGSAKPSGLAYVQTVRGMRGLAGQAPPRPADPCPPPPVDPAGATARRSGHRQRRRTHDARAALRVPARGV